MSSARSLRNIAILASAGSRKTTTLVDLALGDPSSHILLTTYTNENLAHIREYLIRRYGCIPPNVELLSWFTFLLQDGVRPYQRALCSGGRIASLYFDRVPKAASRVPKSQATRYYLTGTRSIYRDRTSDFVYQANVATVGAVVRRLERIYDHILIDEVQDMAGWDLDVLECLLASNVAITCVGDFRQTTFRTNNNPRNSQYRGTAMIDWFKGLATRGLLKIEERVDCYRCNQAICDFADALYPELSRTQSLNSTRLSVSGIEAITRLDVPAYVRDYSPQVLRHNRRADTMNLPAINFGVCKGRTYDHVLIFPTEPIRKYWNTRDLSVLQDRSRLYVAVTRASHSVRIVID
jgi:DNA helicase II / ATP-dependent DNA helicase PcrA